MPNSSGGGAAAQPLSDFAIDREMIDEGFCTTKRRIWGASVHLLESLEP